MDPNNNWRGDGVEQEVRAFTEYLNMVLVGDPTLQAYLPIPLDGGLFLKEKSQRKERKEKKRKKRKERNKEKEEKKRKIPNHTHTNC